MTDLDIKLPDTVDAAAVPTIVEEVCASAGLYPTMKSPLKKHPGCTHWHFKKGAERGILEVTWWPREAEAKPARLWLSVHGNRTADWIVTLKPEIRASIEAQLRREPNLYR